MFVQVTAKNVGGVFSWDTVYIQSWESSSSSSSLSSSTNMFRMAYIADSIARTTESSYWCEAWLLYMYVLLVYKSSQPLVYAFNVVDFSVHLHVMQRMVLLSQFCPSICLSVRCVYCDKTKWCTADILIPRDRAITLVFWHQQWLVGDALFPWNIRRSDPHLGKTPTSTDFRS